MVPGADGDSLLVEDCADVVGVDAFEREGDDARLDCRGSDDAQAFDLLQALRRIQQQIMLVGSDGLDADRVHVVDRSSHSDHAGDVRRSRFELVRERVVGRFLETDRENHVAATLVGGHGIEDRFLPVQHAHAGWPIDFVRGERVEVAVQSLNVHSQVRHALSAVDHHDRPVLVGHGDHFLNGVDGAEGVGGMPDGNELRARGEHARVFVEQELAGIIHRDDAEPGSLLIAQHLPGNDVGVMLDRRDEDFVS